MALIDKIIALAQMIGADIKAKADLVAGKVPTSQLPPIPTEFILSATLDFPQMAQNGNTALTIPDARVTINDFVVVNKPPNLAAATIFTAYCSTGAVTVRVYNIQASTVNVDLAAALVWVKVTKNPIA